MTTREDARARILLYFLLGIALPSGLLGYLAFRGIQNDRALVERERRMALDEAATLIDNAATVLLDEAKQALFVSSIEALSQAVEDRPVVDAIFTVSAVGDVRVLATGGLLFEHDGAATARPEGSSAPDLESAANLEFRAGDLETALAAYQSAVRRAVGAAARARALAGAARVQRKLGRWHSAAESYERLRTEFGDLPSEGGVPPGPAAGLELARILNRTGETARAQEVLLELYEDLVSGRWRLTPARFDLIAQSATATLDSVYRVSPSAAGDDRLSALVELAAEQRERALLFLAFEERASELMGDAGSDLRRFTVNARGRTVPAVLLEPASDSPRDLRHGFFVDPRALADGALARLPDAVGRELSWQLRGSDGEVIGGSPELPAPEGSRTSLPLAGFSQWTLEVAHSAASDNEGFLASRRAIYLYAFVLLAGILLFGLTLSIRTVSRELELARMQSDFVSTVSHEFKSPLTAIRQLAELLRSGRVPSEQRRQRYYDVLLEQSERLSRLVDNVLDFARMEAGRDKLSPELVDLAALVEGTVSEARHRVAHEGFTIRTELEGTLPRLHLDPDAVRQALGNLIDNGVKYSGESRELEVRGFRDEGEVVLSVRDFGVGMQPDEAARVFERFYRGGDALTRAVKGTGLGLTLVKRIVEAHGGRVDVTSAPGAGSTFSIRLPANGAGVAEPGQAS